MFVQTAFTRVDPKTGRPEYDPERKPGVGKTVRLLSDVPGCKELAARRVQPTRHGSSTFQHQPTSARMLTGQQAHVSRGYYLHRRTQRTATSFRAPTISEKPAAWNVDTGKKVLVVQLRELDRIGVGILTTASGLVFGGGTSDRMFQGARRDDRKAVVADTNEFGCQGQPSTFTVDGRQYVAVMSGWGGDARGVQARLNRIQPGRVS